jgi:hypothetical protein
MIGGKPPRLTACRNGLGLDSRATIRPQFQGRRKMRNVITGLALALLVCFGAGLACGNPYVITDLGTFANGRTSAAYGINNAGQVVGWAELKINSIGHGSRRAAGLRLAEKEIVI